MILRLVFFAALGLWLAVGSALADSPQAANEHVRSAFLFAERRQWQDATLHARRSGDPALLRLMEWLSYLDADSGASFTDISGFMTEHPQWPQQKRLQLRAEQAISRSSTSDEALLAWFADYPPITGAGKIAQAEALLRAGDKDDNIAATLLREGWIAGDFDRQEARRILEAHDRQLTPEDHLRRLDRLLWDEKLAAAKDMLPLVSQSQRQLASARMALIRDDADAPRLVGELPSSLAAHAGVKYERMRWRARRDDDEGVREILLSLPSDVPYPEKWWDYRERNVREAVDEGKYKLAAKLLEHHGLKEGSDFVDASWLKGWIKLEFLNQPDDAYDIFEQMYETVRFPVSRARAAYWAARAAEADDRKSDATSWYERASAYPTAFYGQLAALKAHGHAPLRFAAEPKPSQSAMAAFERNLLPRAVKLAIHAGRHDLASRLLTSVIEEADSKGEAAMMAMIGQKAGQPFLSVRAAKKVMQHHNSVLLKAGYPTPATPEQAAVERALVLAITRQESEFDADAKSPANAMGMMQVLPGTAKETARKAGLSYHVSQLYEPHYSWLIGSHYLNRMIRHYDGSYILAIAAYNAGPGNVRRWIAEFGRPGNSMEEAVQWIEKIPFKETRNYVQRVLENLQVYRHLLAGDDAPTLKLSEDLLR